MGIMKFRKNPERKASVSIDGVIFDDNTVVAGERWTKWTAQMFPGKPPFLVRAKDDAVVNTWHPKDQSIAPPKNPNALRAVISTVSPGERRKQEEDEKEKRRLVKEAAEKAAISEEKRPMARVAAPRKREKAPKPAPKKQEPASSHGLTDLPGVGEARAQTLMEAGYGSVGSVAKADVNELVKAIRKTGGRVNIATARQIIRAAKALI